MLLGANAELLDCTVVVSFFLNSFDFAELLVHCNRYSFVIY